MKGRLTGVILLLTGALLAGCRAGTAPQELEELRARAATLEAESSHLRGQISLVESERDQLRERVAALEATLARTEAAGAQAPVSAGQNLVVLPREVRPGEWIAVYVRNYPVRLLSQAGVALRGAGDGNLTHVKRLAAANLFLLPVPATVKPGDYRVVLGEAGTLGPGAKLDDQVAIVIRR